MEKLSSLRRSHWRRTDLQQKSGQGSWLVLGLPHRAMGLLCQGSWTDRGGQGFQNMHQLLELLRKHFLLWDWEHNSQNSDPTNPKTSKSQLKSSLMAGLAPIPLRYKTGKEELRARACGQVCTAHAASNHAEGEVISKTGEAVLAHTASP